jgi:6-phosphofructokinase
MREQDELTGIGVPETMDNDIRQPDLTMLSVVLGLGKDTAWFGGLETLRTVVFCIKQSEDKKC